MEPSSEVVTVLFTDVVGSTELLTRLGDDPADALRRSHFATLRAAIAEHRGREVKSLGDGLMVAFASARDAVACAAAMQRAVNEQPDALGLRIGIDAGEPIYEDDDLFGTPVVIARRLCDAAEAGQVLLSDVVKLLVGRRISFELEPHGSVDLKGLDTPVTVHAVRWRGHGPRIRMCGGLAVEHHGERLDERLPSRQARMLFALLALRHGHELSREALCDALWPREAPRSRASALRALLTGARRVFGSRSIHGRERVQLVLPEGTWIDVDEAKVQPYKGVDALGRAYFDAALTAARRAGELTAEELLAGLSAPWIEAERAELAELSLRALEIESRASLQVDRPSDAEHAARRLIERAPYRESAHGSLMEALAAQGNLAEATLAFDRLRTVLREELGTAPEPGVVALHERLIAQDAAPEAASARPGLPVAIARAARRPFVARGDERARVDAAWEAARAGDGRVVMLAGEPGIGKTSLVAVFAKDAHAAGAAVLLGRCHPEALVPYEPFAEALRQLPPAMLQERAERLARVVPELRAGSAVQDEDPAARYLLFDAVAGVLTDWARAAPLIVVLEDLHWADAPTLLLLKHVARAGEQAPLLLLGTYRSTEAVTDLDREVPLERIALGGLSDDEVGQLIGALHGRRASWPLGSAMCRDTAGNPLFVGQLLRHLTDAGVLVERDGELGLAAQTGRLGVPDSVKDLVARRLAGLGPDVVDVLRSAAVIGRAFEHHLVAAVDERDPDSALDDLEQAISAGLVEEVSRGQHAFVHALVREAIYERAGAGRRVRLHRRVAELLEVDGADPAELAHHYLAAGDRAKGLEYSVVAAERALAQLAFEDAAAHYARGLEALGDGEPDRRCDLLLALGDALARAGDAAGSREVFRAAAELAGERHLPDRLARAALGYGGRVMWDVSRDDDDLASLIGRALEALGEEDSELRVLLLCRLAGGPLRDARFPRERRAELTRQALEMARRLDHQPTLAYALEGYILGHHGPDHTVGQLELARELVDVALAVGDKERAVEAYEGIFDSCFELGDIASAAEALDAMDALANELRQPAQRWFAAVYRALLTLHEAHLEDAETRIAEAREIGDRALSWNAQTVYGLQTYVLRWHQGRLEEVAAMVRRAAAETPTYPILRCALAHLEAQLHPRSREAFDALAANDFADLPWDEEWLVSVSLLAEAARIHGDSERADILYTRLLPYADRVAISYPEISLGSASRYLGLLAATGSRWDDAARHFEDALKTNERTGARAWLASTLDDYGAMLLRREHRDEARARLADAADRYRALGMEHWAARAEALAAGRGGVRLRS